MQYSKEPLSYAMVAIRAAASPGVEIEYVEKDLLMGPVAVVAVTHSLLYWLMEGQEEDLGTMARSCWEERMKDAELKGRRTASAGRRVRGRMPLACLLTGWLACLLGLLACYTTAFLLPCWLACYTTAFLSCRRARRDAQVPVPVPISPLQNPD